MSVQLIVRVCRQWRLVDVMGEAGQGFVLPARGGLPV